jgi:hypothetical protein
MIATKETKMLNAKAAKAYGIVDALGYLFCADCAETLEKKADALVFEHPHKAERCDRCGDVLNEKASR